MAQLKSYLYLMSSAVTLTLVSCSDDKGVEAPDNNPGPVSVTVLDFNPAPGQFVNEIPEYTTGDTPETMRAKAQDALNSGKLISLGAFGGNITLRLERPITRSLDGSPDFRIHGNAFLNTAETAEEPLGSAEPGIVMVSADDNGNGIADDTWYVLAGENFDQAVFTTVTYSDNSAAADNTLFVAWTDNHGNSGYIIRNVAFHNHSFFPSWKANKQLSFSGFRLPDNGFFDKKSRVFRQHVLWGYADSWPNNSTRGDLSLYNARTLDNKPADVTKIDFIRIYTGVLQNNGPLGETSTEISAIEALH